MNKAIVFFVGILVLSSCVEAEYEDVSKDKEYSDLIGQKYRLTEDLVIHGVLGYPKQDKVVDYYVVTEKPGFGGPEVVSYDVLHAGALIRIEKVMDCTNCFESGVHLQVELLSQEQYDDHRVSLYVEPSYTRGKAIIDSTLVTSVVD